MPDASMRIILTLAFREFRVGTRGFRVFLACMALGVAAIAAVGTVRSSLDEGLKDAGARLLGGDVQLEFTYRYADEDEQAWMEANTRTLSEIVVFRSMAVVPHDDGGKRALTQLKAVDSSYPLVGTVQLEPDIDLIAALTTRDGLPGAVMKPELAERLGLEIGDTFRLGLNEFRITARLVNEPDSTGGSVTLGPRTIVHSKDLAGSGLLGPGTLFESRYRMLLDTDAGLDAMRSDAEARFIDKGVRWQDSRNGAPGASAVIERVGAFLVIIGLGGLIIGGVGISLAIGTYLDSKTSTIATLKVLGASQRTVFMIYLLQVMLLLAIGIGIGLVLGILLPHLFQGALMEQIGLPAIYGIYLAPVLEATSYGLLIGLIFSIWSLSRTARVKPSTLYRSQVEGTLFVPPVPYLVVIVVLVTLFVAVAAIFSGTATLTLYVALGTTLTLVTLFILARVLRWVSGRYAASNMTRGRPALRLALGSIGGPGPGTAPIILALGLGFTVLATVGQVSTNLVSRITGDLPQTAPEFFIIDIQNVQFDDYMDLIHSIKGVSRVESSPMLRGIITGINGQKATDVAGNHWVLRGDRGITYSEYPPDGTLLTEGKWWPPGYDGEPQVSFSDEEARELNLKIGDRITLNVLGRDIDAVITSFRIVDFSSAGIGFIISMNPAALANAPHTYISTVYGTEDIGPRIVKQVSETFPNVTAISVREGITNFMQLLQSMIAAITYAALATLAIGFVVVIGATAREEASRIYEAAILKTLGASRRTILASLAIRSTIVGILTGSIAVLAGSLAGLTIMVYAMDSSYAFEPVSAIVIVTGGALTSLLSGLAFSARPLKVQPSAILQERE